MACYGYGALLAVSLIIVMTNHISSDSTKGKEFDTARYSGIHVSGEESESLTTNSVEKCVLLCMRGRGCKSISFDSESKQCHLNKILLSQFTNGSKEYINTSVYIPVPAGEGPWTMVFRATSGNEQSVLHAWNNVGHVDVITDSSQGCTTVDGRLPCDRHFRFEQLDNVGAFKEAMFAFYNEGMQVAYVTFDAQGASEWNAVFKFDRIIDTSFQDLADNTAARLKKFCNVLGLCTRLFYLHSAHLGCNNDIGWMLVMDTPSDPPKYCCTWDNETITPSFRYSTLETFAVSRTEDFGYADTFGVFVKF